jgi:hypothetical protein
LRATSWTHGEHPHVFVHRPFGCRAPLNRVIELLPCQCAGAARVRVLPGIVQATRLATIAFGLLKCSAGSPFVLGRGVQRGT